MLLPINNFVVLQKKEENYNSYNIFIPNNENIFYQIVALPQTIKSEDLHQNNSLQINDLVILNELPLLVKDGNETYYLTKITNIMAKKVG